MAVVEPLLPKVSPEEIRAEITAAQRAAEDEAAQLDDASLYGDFEDLVPETEVGESTRRPAQPQQPPSEAEVRAGFARIAALLTGVR